MDTILKNGMTIGKAKVTVDIVKKGNVKIRPAVIIIPKYITYHNTGNSGKGANADAHNKYIHNMAGLQPKDTSYASWHFTVDHKNIYQHLPLNEMAWHCGDGSGAKSGNKTSIGIEICENIDMTSEQYKQAEENAIALGVYLASLLKIAEDNHVPHQKWSGKYCPRVILKRDGSFTKFHNRIKTAIKNGNTTATAQPKRKPLATAKGQIGIVTVIGENLNLYKSNSLKSEVICKVPKGGKYRCYAKEGDMYNLGGSWCSADPKHSTFEEVIELPSNVYGIVYILADTLNVREKADLNSKIVKTVKKGDAYRCYGVKNGLYNLSANMYVSASKSYTELVNNPLYNK